jgi:hypothetical protein
VDVETVEPADDRGMNQGAELRVALAGLSPVKDFRFDPCFFFTGLFPYRSFSLLVSFLTGPFRCQSFSLPVSCSSWALDVAAL